MYRGVQPGKEKLAELSKPLGLTVVQIQKWFWDKNQNDIQEMAQAQVLLKQRMEQEEAFAKQDEAIVASPAKTGSEISENSVEISTESEVQTKSKQNQTTDDGSTEVFQLAEELKYPLKFISEVIVDLPSPTKTRCVEEYFDSTKSDAQPSPREKERPKVLIPEQIHRLSKPVQPLDGAKNHMQALCTRDRIQLIKKRSHNRAFTDLQKDPTPIRTQQWNIKPSICTQISKSQTFTPKIISPKATNAQLIPLSQAV